MEAIQSSSSLFRENASLPQDSANAAQEEININLIDMKTVPLVVKRSETVKNLKEMVHAKFGHSENMQELFTVERLADTQTLVDCGIEKDSTVNLIVQSFEAMKMYIRSISDQKTIVLEAKTSDTIRQIKTEIQKVVKIHPDEFTLFYDGKVLKDDNILAFVKVQNDSTFYLVLSPKEVIPIYVRKPGGDLVKLEVKVAFKVRDLKKLICITTSISSSDFHLVFSGVMLDDWQILADYDVREGSILDILPQEFQIFVKTLTGETITLEVNRDDTIKALKLKFRQKMKRPSPHCSVTLRHGWKDLVDDQKVADYDIHKDTTLFQLS